MGDVEIINADSRQVYKYFSIVTAKPDGEWVKCKEYPEKQFVSGGVVHHLMDFLAPDKFYSAGQFYEDACGIIAELHKKNVVPVIVGGTGLYIRSLIAGLAEIPKVDTAVRARLYERLEHEGLDKLVEELSGIDPGVVLNSRVEIRNPRRVIRALEVYHGTGLTLTAWHKRTVAPKFNNIVFGIEWPREELYKRINTRVKRMWDNGALEEVKGVIKLGYDTKTPGFEGLGVNHIVQYLRNCIREDQVVSLWKRDTRRYAKRQLTWFKREPNIRWIKMSEQKSGVMVAVEEIINLIRGTEKV